MVWASTISAHPSLERALAEALDEILTQLGGQDPDLVTVFVDPTQFGQHQLIPDLIGARLAGSTLLGCVAGGVVGGGLEVERGPALSLTAAVLPGVELFPFHIEAEEVEALETDPALWRRRLELESAGPSDADAGERASPPGFWAGPGEAPEDVGADSDLSFLLIPEPFSVDTGGLIRSLDAAFPLSPKAGGLASGGTEPEDSVLFLGADIYTTGTVGVAMRGDVIMDTIVAQGCRPIGAPLFVTWAEDNRIYQLEGRKASQVLAELFDGLSPEDQVLASRSMFLGLVMEEGKETYDQGDFLIRNLIGVDPESGVLAVGERLNNGQVVQFHVRDAHASSLDLHNMLTRYTAANPGRGPRGALLFSCLGRGVRLYGEPHHDSRLIMEHLGKLPIGGFFCNGEIGPVGGRSYLHGYTSSIALFRPRSTH